MTKFKVGQKVRIKRNVQSGDISTHSIHFVSEMSEYIGKIVTIKGTNIWGESYKYHIEEDKERWSWDEEWFESVDEVKTKDDLKDFDIVTLANGDRLSFFDGGFTDLSDGHTNDICDLDDLNDDLTFAHDYNREENKVVKVERPLSYYEVFNRDEQVREMTVEEISKALGYEVKIVKEK